MTLCDACAEEELADFADLGDVPAQVGVHWDSHGDAVASPTGRLTLASCPGCGYVRNVAYDPSLVTYDTTVDTTLYHSVAFQQFSVDLVHNLNERYDLSGRLVLDIGCGQGEFLRELCKVSGANGVGYDARYAGEPGNNGATTFHSSLAPRRTGLPKFDFFLSRHWFEQVNDPYDFLVDLREQARGREVFGYLEISDAVAKDDAEHKLHIAAAGYTPHDETIRFDESQRLRIELKKAATAGRPTGKKDPKGGDDRIDTQSPY